jgi:hypothetical protein
VPTSAPGLGSLPASCLLGASRAARHAQPQRSAFAQVRSIGFVLGYGLLIFAERAARVALYSLRARYSRGLSVPSRSFPASASGTASGSASCFPSLARPPGTHSCGEPTAPCAETASSAGWLGPGADVGRCGTGEPSPGADVGRVKPSPGADVERASLVPAQMWHGCAQPHSAAAAHAEPERGTPMPHLHWDSAHPWPHLHRDSARLCHICTGTGSACPPPWCSIGRTLYSLRSVAHSQDSAARHCRTLLAARCMHRFDCRASLVAR